MTRLFLAASVAVCVLGLESVTASAAKFNKKVDIGDKAAAWEDLKGTDGKTHSMDDYKNADVLVIAFSCNHCPVANAYEERFNKLAETFAGRKVRMVAISVSEDDVDSLENMTQRAKDKGYKFAYLQDLSQDSARAYGALVTPHLYVLDKHRNIAYMGAFDDSMNPAQVEKHYVQDAVQALLDGKQPEIKESLQFGCGIQYKRK
jgi:peroxiredoxin